MNNTYEEEYVQHYITRCVYCADDSNDFDKKVDNIECLACDRQTHKGKLFINNSKLFLNNVG
jgi:hypothetical protein